MKQRVWLFFLVITTCFSPRIIIASSCDNKMKAEELALNVIASHPNIPIPVKVSTATELFEEKYRVYYIYDFNTPNGKVTRLGRINVQKDCAWNEIPYAFDGVLNSYVIEERKIRQVLELIPVPVLPLDTGHE